MKHPLFQIDLAQLAILQKHIGLAKQAISVNLKTPHDTVLIIK